MYNNYVFNITKILLTSIILKMNKKFYNYITGIYYKKNYIKKKLLFVKLKKLSLEQKLFKATGKLVILKIKNVYNTLNSKYLIKVPKNSRM